jgi:hypothetical protein
MLRITCDVCKKVIEDAEKDVNYYTFRDMDICRPCKKKFDRDMEDRMEEVDPFHFHQYWKTYNKELMKAVK